MKKTPAPIPAETEPETEPEVEQPDRRAQLTAEIESLTAEAHEAGHPHLFARIRSLRHELSALEG